MDLEDLDSQLYQRFSSLCTSDKESLVAQLQHLLNDQLNKTECLFFLDMNNWNVQNAVCSYFDLDQPRIDWSSVPNMCLIKDEARFETSSSFDGGSLCLAPSSLFEKCWTIENCGQQPWPPGCSLRFVQGDLMHVAAGAGYDRIMVDCLSPGQSGVVTVQMRSPEVPGTYAARWRMSTPTGLFFGDTVWVIVTVVDVPPSSAYPGQGLCDQVTERLASAHISDGSNPQCFDGEDYFRNCSHSPNAFATENLSHSQNSTHPHNSHTLFSSCMPHAAGSLMDRNASSSSEYFQSHPSVFSSDFALPNVSFEASSVQVQGSQLSAPSANNASTSALPSTSSSQNSLDF